MVAETGMRVVDLVFAGTSLDKARRIFERMTTASAAHPADHPAAIARSAATPAAMIARAYPWRLQCPRAAKC